MSIYAHINDTILAAGKYEGQRIGDVGSTYLGYAYIKYKCSEGDPLYVEYILDNPVQPVCTWDECKNYRLPFGKHKGKSLQELAESLEERSYLSYLFTWEAMSERALVQRMVQAFDKLPEPALDTAGWKEWTMPYGKYKGTNMFDLGSSDVGYLRYLFMRMQKKPSPANNFLGARIHFILEQLK